MALRVYLLYYLTSSLWSEGRVDGLLTQLPHPLPDENHIDYSDNNITVIDYIESVPSMVTFTMENNGLKVFPDFENNTQIVSLKLQTNEMRFIPAKLLDILTNLQNLDVRHNHLSSFPDSMGLQSLVTLHLSYNELTVFPSFLYIGRSLKKLHLSFNQISSMSSEKMAHFKRLSTIFIKSNNFTGQVPDVRFLKTVSLAVFKGNHFTDFKADVIDGLAQPFTLHLQNNEIRHLTGTFHLNNRTLQSSVTVHLRLNPISCDCKAKWLKQAITDGNPVIVDAVCATPESLLDQPLSLVGIADLVCGKHNRPSQVVGMLCLVYLCRK